jgi:hypothetical protein
MSKHFEVRKAIADVNNQTKHNLNKLEKKLRRKKYSLKENKIDRKMKRSLIQMMSVIIRQHWILTWRDIRDRE